MNSILFSRNLGKSLNLLNRHYVRTLRTTANLLNSNIFNIQDEDDFKKRVLQNPKPVIVDFHAQWCGPCKILGPRLETSITAASGKVEMAKVDIDELQELAIEYGVEAVPTVLSFKNGKMTDKFVGNADDDQIKSFVDKSVGSK